jgi:predicted transcriptional regulator
VAIRLDKAEINKELKQLEGINQKIETFMTHPILTLLENEHLGAATVKMVKAGLKRLPVVNKQGKLIGMLSRLDILRQVAQVQEITRPEEAIPPHAIRTVQDIMTTSIPMVNQDDDLSAVIDKFALSDSHRLIVIDPNGKAIGLISDSDVVARVQPARRQNILDSLRRVGKPVPGKETAYELMSPGLLTARPDLPVVDAIKMMISLSRKWLVVIDESEKPLGLVNRELLLASLALIQGSEE